MTFKNILLILSILLFFSACRKDVIETSPTTTVEIPPSEQIEVSELTGLVLDNENRVIVGAKVQLFENGNIIDETFSNENGSFTFHDVVEGDYYISAQDEDFISNVTLVDLEADIELEIILISEDDIPFNEDTATEYLPENPILISGKIVNQDGVGVKSFIFVGGEVSDWFNFASSDEEGNFKVLVEKGEAFHYFILGNSSCLEPEMEDTLGPFYEDTEIGELSQDYSDLNYISISGMVVDCQGDPVIQGFVSITSSFVKTQVPIINGFYEVSLSLCGDESINILAVSNDDYLLTQISPSINSPLELNIDLCNQFDGYLNVEIGGKMIPIDEYHIARCQDNFTFIEPFQGYFYEDGLYIDFIEIGGAYLIEYFQFIHGENLYSNNQELEFDITSETDDDFIEGTLSGIVEDLFGNEEDIIVEFKVEKIN